MQSVLLPGGLGYIGSITTAALYKYFQDKKYKIIIIDNLVNSSVAVKDRINKHLNTENAFEFYEISILDVPKLKQLFEDQI